MNSCKDIAIPVRSVDTIDAIPVPVLVDIKRHQHKSNQLLSLLFWIEKWSK